MLEITLVYQGCGFAASLCRSRLSSFPRDESFLLLSTSWQPSRPWVIQQLSPMACHSVFVSHTHTICLCLVLSGWRALGSFTADKTDKSSALRQTRQKQTGRGGLGWGQTRDIIREKRVSDGKAFCTNEERTTHRKKRLQHVFLSRSGPVGVRQIGDPTQTYFGGRSSHGQQPEVEDCFVWRTHQHLHLKN